MHPKAIVQIPRSFFIRYTVGKYIPKSAPVFETVQKRHRPPLTSSKKCYDTWSQSDWSTKMVVTHLRPAAFVLSLLCPQLTLPVLAYQSKLDTSSARITPVRSRPSVARETPSFPEGT